MDTYKAEFKKLGVSFDEDLLTKVAKGCGPSIYNKDASTVAGSDPKELATVKNNFLIGKLGMKDGADLDKGISKVIDTFGSSNKNKYRAMFYYMLTK
ncbi:MAG: DUF2853 family protein [Flavobacteriales bacterium]|jgi:hypothetical protein|nr:DUF2853 family protein [Flavobacteriales bacterium]MDG1175289.1 DUF2853 family protein [Flavobacteriales bacterium]